MEERKIEVGRRERGERERGGIERKIVKEESEIGREGDTERQRERGGVETHLDMSSHCTVSS